MDAYIINKITDLEGNEYTTQDYLSKKGKKCFINCTLDMPCMFQYISEDEKSESGFITSKVQGIYTNEEEKLFGIQTVDSLYFLKYLEDTAISN